MVGSPESGNSSSTGPAPSPLHQSEAEAGSSQPLAAAVSLEIKPLPVWPPYRCNCCCQILREIIHTDDAGRCATKLEIHGRLGTISHAIFEIKHYRLNNTLPSPSEFHMIDFCGKSLDTVHKYLQQYCDDQKRAGLFLVQQDPLSPFYKALLVGMHDHVNNNNN